MAAARTFLFGAYTEGWAEAAWQDGGAAQNCDTEIPIINAADLDNVNIIFQLDAVQGSPVFSRTLTLLATGKLRVTITNTAAAGNRAKWTAWVIYSHSFTR
jgi:hypothetical protein